jgi:TolA-binding protein
MADEGDGLHEPWAPPPDGAPAEPDADVPTGVTPIDPALDELDDMPPPPVEPVLLPEVVPPSSELAAPRRRWPGSAKAIVIILAVLLVGTAAGLGYAWWKTNEDKKDLETASNQQGQELSQQLDKANKDNAALQEQLTEANAKVTDLQGQLTTAQDDAAAAKQQSAALAGLFPLTPQKEQAGLPGTYRMDPASAAPGGCSLATCPPVQLTLTIESSGGALTVSDPALGRATLTPTGGGWTATGPAPAPFQLTCNGAPQPTNFTLTVGATAVALDAQNAPQVTSLGGGLLLSSAAVPATAEPVSAGCPPGVAVYILGGNRT